MDTGHWSFILSITTSVLSIFALVIAFFTKRQFKAYDDSAKESAQNKSDIAVMKNRIDRLEDDVGKFNDRFDEVKDFIADQVKGLSREITALAKIVTDIRINCAAVGHSELVKQHTEEN